MQKLLVSKVSSLILLTALRLIAGLLPLKIFRKMNKWCRRGDKNGQQLTDRRKKIDLFLSIFLCFGGGLLVSTTFIHMLPEVRESFEEAKEKGKWPILDAFPFAEGVVCLGFFAVYFLEELGEQLIPREEPTANGASATDPRGPITVTHASDLRHRHQDLSRAPESSASDCEDRSTSQSVSLSRSQGLLEKQTAYSSGGAVKPIDAHGDSHGHSHAPVFQDLKPKSVAAAVRGFLLVMALSFHSVFEGMAIGLQTEVRDVWFLFGAVTVHELAIMFCLGLEMLASNIRILIYVIYMVSLSIITPIGVGIGIFITEYSADPSPTHTLVVAILQGVAAGTLLYVTFMEVLERERKKEGHRLVKFLSVFLGFVLLSLLEAAGHAKHLSAVEELSSVAPPVAYITSPFIPST